MTTARLPAVTLEMDAAVHERDTFVLEPRPLRVEVRRRAPLAIDYPVARDAPVGARGERPADLARAARGTQERRELSVGRDPPARDASDEGVDEGVPGDGDGTTLAADG